MRNLILVHCKRFFFRWEAFAVTLFNLFLSVCSIMFAVLLYDPVSIIYIDFHQIIYAVTIVSLCCTAAAVTFIEINTLSTGAARNLLIAGYSKAQVFLSKYVAVAVFSVMQGAILFVPLVIANDVTEIPVRLTVSMLLMYAAVSCILMTVCLLSDRPTVYTVIAIGFLVLCNAGGNTFSRLLAHPQYVEVNLDPDTKTLVQFDDPKYVSSPAREIIDQALCMNPVQPIFEYYEWYLQIGDSIDYQKSIQTFEMQIAESKDDDQRKAIQTEMENYKLKYGSHLNRIVVFPYYQISVLAVFCIGGTLIFRKRNLK